MLELLEPKREKYDGSGFRNPFRGSDPDYFIFGKSDPDLVFFSGWTDRDPGFCFRGSDQNQNPDNLYPDLRLWSFSFGCSLKSAYSERHKPSFGFDGFLSFEAVSDATIAYTPALAWRQRCQMKPFKFLGLTNKSGVFSIVYSLTPKKLYLKNLVDHPL